MIKARTGKAPAGMTPQPDVFALTGMASPPDVFALQYAEDRWLVIAPGLNPCRPPFQQWPLEAYHRG